MLAYGTGSASVLVVTDHSGSVFWSQGFGSWGSSDSNDNAASIDRNTSDLLISAYDLVGDWRLGLLTGYSHSSFKANDRASSATSENHHLGLYGGTTWSNIAFQTSAAYSWHNVDSHRGVSIPGFTDRLSADYRAETLHAFGELGYSLEMENRLLFEPLPILHM